VKKRLRGLLILLVVLAVLGAIAYGASWLNHRRYYLVVGPASVQIGKGRMLPMGWEPFRPDDPSLRRAYAEFELPGGIKVARGTTIFVDRVELDQALFRLLSDAARYAMSRDTARSPKLVQGYIERLEALPGVSIDQQVELQKLRRQAEFARARQLVRDAAELLAKATEAFEASAGGEGPEHAEAWAELSRRAHTALAEGPTESAPVPTIAPRARKPVAPTTKASTTTATMTHSATSTATSTATE